MAKIAVRMPRNRYYYYDHESCSFVEVRTKRSRIYLQGSALLLVAFLLASALSWGVDEFSQTPQELALMAENDVLQRELSHISERMDSYSEKLDELNESDKDLYRTIFQVEPISEDVRQVGVGGVDPYEDFGRFSTSTAAMLRTTSEKLDKLERQIGLQNSSYRELARLADEREMQLKEMPAILPANGPLVSGYGMRRHPILRVRKMHRGIDVLVDTGSPVVATGDGVIKKAEYNSSYGHHVIVDHTSTGYSTVYAHLSEIPSNIRPGTAVERGEAIGVSGNTGRSTGPHLHYEVRDADGRRLNPVLFVAPSMTPPEYKKLLEETERSTMSLD